MKKAKFLAACKSAFAELMREHDLKLAESGGDITSAFVRFANATTGIECLWDARDGGVFVKIARLEKGKFPDEPVFIDKDAQINIFFVDNLIELRGDRDTLPVIGPIMTDTEIGKAVSTYARLLKKHAEDVLCGDFQVFPKIKQIIISRKRTLDKQQP